MAGLVRAASIRVNSLTLPNFSATRAMKSLASGLPVVLASSSGSATASTGQSFQEGLMSLL